MTHEKNETANSILKRIDEIRESKVLILKTIYFMKTWKDAEKKFALCVQVPDCYGKTQGCWVSMQTFNDCLVFEMDTLENELFELESKFKNL